MVDCGPTFSGTQHPSNWRIVDPPSVNDSPRLSSQNGRETPVNQERRLGRGLEALLGRPLDGSDEFSGGVALTDAAPGSGAATISVYSIDSNPYQPRQDFDEAQIDELAENLRTHGLLQPIVVRQAGDRYQVVAGERRLRAAVKCGWESIAAIVRDADDRQMAELAIVENLHRKDLNPLEKAASFQRYLEQYGCTHEELAKRLSITRSTVANLVRLLELPESVQQSLRDGKITQGHARALLPLGDEQEQIAYCERIQKQSLSVRAIEDMVQEAIVKADAEPLALYEGAPDEDPEKRARAEHISALEHELRTVLGTKVEVRQAKNGRGRIVVHFASNDEFERIRDQFYRSAGHERAAS